MTFNVFGCKCGWATISKPTLCTLGSSSQTLEFWSRICVVTTSLSPLRVADSMVERHVARGAAFDGLSMWM